MKTEFWWRQDEPWWAELYLWPLTLCSIFYAGGAALARALARPRRAAVPVISVGNLTVGGAGKTPVVLALAERLLAKGRRPAVVSRGYGRLARAPWLLVETTSSAEQCGDEPLLLKRRLPALLVLVGARRSLLADQAVRLGADVILLDDGLQHHGLARDLEVEPARERAPLAPRSPAGAQPAAGRAGWAGPALAHALRSGKEAQARAWALARPGREPLRGH